LTTVVLKRFQRADSFLRQVFELRRRPGHRDLGRHLAELEVWRAGNNYND